MTRNDVLYELNRELGLRRSLYPKWMFQGKLHKNQAKKQLSRMEKAFDLINAMTLQEFEAISKRLDAPATGQAKLF